MTEDLLEASGLAPDAKLVTATDPQGRLLCPPNSNRKSSSITLLQLGLALPRCQPSPRIFDSSTGFRLPDGSVFSPDAALVSEERWQALTSDQRRGFPPLCLNLVIDLASASDEGPRGHTTLRRKMDLHQANGTRLGWLLLPQERAAEIWRGGQRGKGERLENVGRLEGSELAEGLGLDLEEIWAV